MIGLSLSCLQVVLEDHMASNKDGIESHRSSTTPVLRH